MRPLMSVRAAWFKSKDEIAPPRRFHAVDVDVAAACSAKGVNAGTHTRKRHPDRHGVRSPSAARMQLQR